MLKCAYQHTRFYTIGKFVLISMQKYKIILQFKNSTIKR